MSVKHKGNYVIPKDSIIFIEGDNVQSLDILLKGKVDVYLSPYNEFDDEENEIEKSFRIFTIDKNIFMGTIDLFLQKKYSFSYKPIENSSLYAYPMKEINNFFDILNNQKELSFLTIISLTSMMNHCYNALGDLEESMRQINLIANNLSTFYWYLKDKYNLTYVSSIDCIKEAKEKYEKDKEDNNLSFKLDLMNTEILNSKNSFIDESIKDKILYYDHIMSLPVSLRKNFFTADNYISKYHFEDVAQSLEKIKRALKDVIAVCINDFNNIYNKNDKCILSELICLIHEANKYNQNLNEYIDIIDDNLIKINDLSEVFLDKYNYKFELDYSDLVKEIKNIEKSSICDNNTEGIPDELLNSFEKILRYSEVSGEKANLMRNYVFRFKDLKASDSNEIREIARNITPIFFEVYENVLKKVINDNNESKLYRMFLEYGYMDEELLTKEQVISLYNLTDINKSKGSCNVYNSYEWLKEIYNMEKEPSINEFDEDYFDVYRKMIKKRQILEKDKTKYIKDKDGRLRFEINNMFKLNHRLCSGQGNHFPILHKDNVIRDLDKSVVTKEKVNEIINKILEIDFSAFHREIFYKNSNGKVEKELVFKPVAPHIILMPVYGSRGSMWQEITGRDRCKPGRIILPIFTSENLEDLLIKMIGNFRWELCRTMMGVAWNDVTKPSLTSEYMDYIQFYKKNKELSEEAKSKLKKQIKKRNNNMRDIFTDDYEIWIKYEQKGNIRLNKVARNILFKNCPFNKNIRERLLSQPIFNNMITTFNNIRGKKYESIKRRYNKLLGSNLSEHPELVENLEFYDM
jgi:hypothetical protein